MKAEQERSSAEQLRAECQRLREETHATTIRTQQANAHKFTQRIRDISFWKQELETALNENDSETTQLLEKKERLEQALEATRFPLEVANSCLTYREKRVSIDLVHDEVEIHLTKVGHSQTITCMRPINLLLLLIGCSTNLLLL